MGFFKKFMGRFLFTLVYVLFFFQGSLYYYIDDEYDKRGTYMSTFKNILYIFMFLSIFSHFQASFTCPGKFNHKNNTQFISFYCDTRRLGVYKADQMNKAHFSKITPPQIDPEDEDGYISDSLYDDTYYEESPYYKQEILDKINSDHGFRFKMCPACNVARMPGTSHCYFCEGCVYQRDHHCPWLNNCVGQFNLKYFILFCFYSMLTCLVSIFFSSYYILYRQLDMLMNNFYFGIGFGIHFIISIACFFLFVRLLWDQYSNLEDMMHHLDIKEARLVELRPFDEVVEEIFGTSFWPMWFIPIGRGGKIDIYRSKKQKFE